MILETLQAVPIYKGRLKLRFTLITKPSSDHHQRSKFCKLSFLSGSPMILGKMRWRRTLLAWAGLIQNLQHPHHPRHHHHHHNSHHLHHPHHTHHPHYLHHPHHTHPHHPHYIMDHQHPWQPLNDGSQHGKWNWKAELPVGQYSGKGQMMMMEILTIMEMVMMMTTTEIVKMMTTIGMDTIQGRWNDHKLKHFNFQTASADIRIESANKRTEKLLK